MFLLSAIRRFAGTRVVETATLTRGTDDTHVLTLSVTVSPLRAEAVYHVYHRENGVLAFHRSYTRGDVIRWPSGRHPGRYQYPDPRAAAEEDYRISVESLTAEGYRPPGE
ncbi:hypothetical protein ACVBEQ_25620 [Nakamurella sp. GG22]